MSYSFVSLSCCSCIAGKRREFCSHILVPISQSRTSLRSSSSGSFWRLDNIYPSERVLVACVVPQEVLGLLAYLDVASSPLAFLMRPEQREAVADQVNSFVLGQTRLDFSVFCSCRACLHRRALFLLCCFVHFMRLSWAFVRRNGAHPDPLAVGTSDAPAAGRPPGEPRVQLYDGRPIPSLTALQLDKHAFYIRLCNEPMPSSTCSVLSK